MIIRIAKSAYLGFLTGFLAAVLLQRSVWLAMRVNIALIIPALVLLGLIWGIAKKGSWPKAWFFGLEIITVLVYIIIYGDAGALAIMPAVLLREGFFLAAFNLGQLNIALLALLICGNILWLLPVYSIIKEEYPMKTGNKLLVKIGVLVVIIAIFAYLAVRHGDIFTLFSSLDVAKVKEYILSFGILAPIVSFFLMVFQSVAAPLPAFLITFANAGLFGWWKGAILSWSSAMAGAALCFFIARFYGRTVVEKLTSKFALESVDIFFEKYGKYAILIARLLPFVSFDIVSYAAGLTSMGFWSFFWATGLGQLPATIVYSYVGGMLVGGAQKFVFGLLILFSLSVLAVLIKKIWTDRNKTQAAKSTPN